VIRVETLGSTTAVPGRAASPVERVELGSDRLTVRLLSLGAAIAGVDAPDAAGAVRPVHLGLASLAEY
jgi:hypothetical protein